MKQDTVAEDQQPMVWVLDDVPMIRRGFCDTLRRNGMRTRGFELAEHVVTALDGERPPDCILIDIKLDGGEMNGIDLCRRLSQTHPSLASLIVTGHGAVGSAVEAMKHGAIDFLEKPLEDGTLLRGVHEAIATTSRQSHRAEEARRARERIATLTRRERQVLDMVVQGRLNKQMAAELGVSHKTIEVHRSHMMKKMQVGSVAELVRLVMLAREQLGDGEGV